LWKPVFVIVRKGMESNSDLVELGDAFCSFAPAARAVDGRQEQRREDGDDGDNHHQFHQAEGVIPPWARATPERTFCPA